jgi:hypothetical protein
VPVQGCTLPLPYSRAIPLLPLWAVRPVQSLSACTRVHFTLTLPYNKIYVIDIYNFSNRLDVTVAFNCRAQRCSLAHSLALRSSENPGLQ